MIAIPAAAAHPTVAPSIAAILSQKSLSGLTVGDELGADERASEGERLGTELGERLVGLVLVGDEVSFESARVMFLSALFGEVLEGAFVGLELGLALGLILSTTSRLGYTTHGEGSPLRLINFRDSFSKPASIASIVLV